jgi:hypothetical protein
MFLRPLAVTALVTASVSLAAAPAAHAHAHATKAADAHAADARAAVRASFRAHWKLNEVSGTTAFDSSANNNDGTSFHVTRDGTGYTFNGVDSRVIVPSSGSLNPGAAGFSFGVTVVMDDPPSPVGETFDVLRKGLVTNKGGDYKFEVKNVKGKALARCVVKSIRADGTKVLASIQGTTTLADGQPHAVTCKKTSTGITLSVDALPARTKTFAGGLGSMSNTADLALGAKAETTAQTGFDWYKGVISDAWVR